MDRLRAERRPGVWYSGGLKTRGVRGRGVGQDDHGGWAGGYGRIEERRGKPG